MAGRSEKSAATGKLREQAGRQKLPRKVAVKAKPGSPARWKIKTESGAKSISSLEELERALRKATVVEAKPAKTTGDDAKKFRGMKFGYRSTKGAAAAGLKSLDLGKHRGESVPTAPRKTIAFLAGDKQLYDIVVIEAAPAEAVAPAPVAVDAYAPGAKARALMRGREQAAKDLAQSGGTFELDEVRTLLHGVSRQRIDKLVSDGVLMTVPGPSNRRRFPVAQFTADGRPLPGLAQVLKSLPTTNPWVILNFLVQPNTRLDSRKPVDLLQAGAVDAVVRAARRLATQDP